MRIGFGLLIAIFTALLLWWVLGKPGLWLRDQLCWVDDLSPSDGAVVQLREMDQPVRLSGKTSWLTRDVAATATQAGELKELAASNLKWVAAARTWGGFEMKLALRRGWNHLLVRCRWLDQRATYSQRVALGEVFIVAGQSNAAGWSGSLFLGSAGNARWWRDSMAECR
jgi:hypothetical protein